jgi:hypothetical protein
VVKDEPNLEEWAAYQGPRVMNSHVAAHGHPVADVVGQQAQPLLDVPLVQQLGFLKEEFLDLVLEQELGDG